MIEVVEYVGSDGRCLFAEWFDSLEIDVAARVSKAVDRMRDGNFGDHKAIGDGVTERRLDFGPGYRIYFGRDGVKLVILVGGGTKRRQSQDIKSAKEAWQEYKATKKEQK
jgi:putative addiction module killer protein